MKSVEEYLKQYIDALDGLEQGMTELARLRSLAEKAGSSVISCVSHSPPCDGSASFEKIIDRIMELELEVADVTASLPILKKEIERIISAVGDSKLCAVLRYKYICGRSHELIAHELKLHTKTINALHTQALEKILQEDLI